MNVRVFRMTIKSLHRKYIKDTKEKSLVSFNIILITSLKKNVCQKAQIISKNVYLSTVMLKHLYDKKPAEEYDSILRNLVLVLKQPDEIYLNKLQKTGSKCFVKTIEKEKYFLVLEENQSEKQNSVVTMFRIRKESYLNDYVKIWSWEGDILHRNI